MLLDASFFRIQIRIPRKTAAKTSDLNLNTTIRMKTHITAIIASLIFGAAAAIAAEAPVFTTQPVNVTTDVGQIATFVVATTGNPAPSYQWQYSTNGGGTWTSFTGGGTSAIFSLSFSSSSANGQQFRCIAANSSGTATSNTATLTISSAPVAPVFVLQPASQTVSAGNNATFTTVINGNPTPAYQWQYSSNGGSTWTNSLSGTTGIASFTSVNVSASSNGRQYRCIATSSSGTTTSNIATLTVGNLPGAPAITTQPASTTVQAGSTASFTVVASGDPVLAYLWQSSTNGSLWTILSSETSPTITIPSTTLAANGQQYRCEVSNPLGSLYSAVATLTVTEAAQPPPVTPQLDVNKFTLSLAQTANSTATFDITSNITWTTRIDPASGAIWLAVAPNAGTGNSTNTVATASSANTTNSPRTASIVVSGSGITRTLIATQAATAASGLAPTGAALPVGATLTLTTTDGTRTCTVAANNKLTTTDASGTVTLAYEYNPAGANATLTIPDLGVYWLKFTSATDGTLILYTADDTGNPLDLAGTFTYAPPAYALTLNSATATPSGSSHIAGTTITITASAAPADKVFDKWTSTPAVTFANATATPTTFTMPANALTVTANYKTVTTGSGGNTGGSGSNSGGGGGGGGVPSLLYLAAAAALLAQRAAKRLNTANRG